MRALSSTYSSRRCGSSRTGSLRIRLRLAFDNQDDKWPSFERRSITQNLRQDDKWPSFERRSRRIFGPAFGNQNESDESESGLLRTKSTQNRIGRVLAMPSSAVIVALARTPIGKFRGSALSHMSAPRLASLAIRGALDRVNGGNDLNLNIVEAYMGNVLSAGIGQAPCRQAVLGAGLPESTICNTINKVCASGMKSIQLAAQTIEAMAHDKTCAMLAGGMESMSNVPHYLPTSRSGQALGHAKIVDGIIHDGLVRSVGDDTCMLETDSDLTSYSFVPHCQWDPYDDQHVGARCTPSPPALFPRLTHFTCRWAIAQRYVQKRTVFHAKTKTGMSSAGTTPYLAHT